jgi:glycosyltransferase involved in cell wall biosynthesis
VTPRVSVCVPTYNGAAFLGETLASISAQTFDDFEALIVDDCSTDDTLAIAERFAQADGRMRVIRNTERAGSGAANAQNCLRHARGDWIKFLAQDDVMAPTCLERMLEASVRGPLVICWHDCRFEPEIDQARYAWRPGADCPLAVELPGGYADADTVCATILRRPYSNFIGPTSSCLIHRDCFAKYGSFDPSFSFFPDLDYWTRVGSREGIAIATEYLVTFRIHDGSISGGIRRDPKRNFREALQRFRRALSFVRSPDFENLRRIAAASSPPIDLEARARALAVEVRWAAVDDSYRRRDRWALDQWEALVAADADVRKLMREANAALPLSTRVKQFVKHRLGDLRR